MGKVKYRKPYRSPQRAEKLDATRRHILEVARKLFGERGYAGTTMEAIAAESGLAIPTVYKNFGNKRRLLLNLIDQTINARVPPQQETVHAKVEPRARLHALAQMCVNLASSAADVVSILVNAAGADPEFRAMSTKMAEGRRRNAGLIARSLAKDRALRPEYTEVQAQDVLYALAGPELYELLVTRSGWSNARFEAWLSSALTALLLSDERRGATGLRPSKGTGSVNGHHDLPLGGQLTSPWTDTRSPGRRTAFLPEQQVRPEASPPFRQLPRPSGARKPR